MINCLLSLNPNHLTFFRSSSLSIIKRHRLAHHPMYHLMNKMPSMILAFLVELVFEMLVFLVLAIHRNFLILLYFDELLAFDGHFELRLQIFYLLNNVFIFDLLVYILYFWFVRVSLSARFQKFVFIGLVILYYLYIYLRKAFLIIKPCT